MATVGVKGLLHLLEHCLGGSDKVTLVTQPLLAVHVFDVPLV